ncbi:MAG: IS481 family transposase, partial [Myxococcales bacterium]|nr:IS481 family transposase [Myxococcales bacterium]
VGRPSPGMDALRDAFRIERRRKQRRSDGTCTVEGVRFEIPSQYRHIEHVRLRYARFDLSRVSMVDPHSGVELCRLRPLDREANADGRRAPLHPETTEPPKPSGPAPHPLRLMAAFETPGKPPAYLPYDRPQPPQENDDHG